MSEVMLPETEWPGRTVMVLDVSLETRDSGRGMNSTRSEKPTRARPTGFGVGLDSSATLAGSLGGVIVPGDSTCTSEMTSVSAAWTGPFVSGKV
jgi:hypothetical protein